MEDSQIDHITMSASCGFPSEPSSHIQAVLGAAGLQRRAKGSKRFSTPSEVIETDNYSTRAALVAASCHALIRTLKSAGIDRKFVEEHDAKVQLYISLSSLSESAGIEMASTVWEPWMALGATLRLDVI